MRKIIYHLLFATSLFFSGCALNYTVPVAELPVTSQIISAKIPLSVGIVLHDENEQKDSVWIDPHLSANRLTISAPSGQILNKYAYKVFSDLFEKIVLLRNTSDIQMVDAVLSTEITDIHQYLISSSGPGGRFQYTTSVSASLTDKKGGPIWRKIVKSPRSSSWSFIMSLDETVMGKAVTESTIMALQEASKEMRYSREILAFSDAKNGIQTTPKLAKSSPANASGPQTSQTYSGSSTGISTSHSVEKQKVSVAAAVPATPIKPVLSDVDSLPEITTQPKKNAYAIVIGIEQYRQKLPGADFAASDARLMSEYLAKVMGYQEENIVTLTNENATKGDLEKYLDQWLKNVVEKDAAVFIYYSGHGTPNPATGDAYLLPYDGDPAFIEQTGYSLKRLYENLSKLRAGNIVVALDSCFSGAGGKSVSAKGSRALVRVEKTNAHNIAVLTASQDNQISSSYEDKGHGVFTYFLLKGIKELLSEDKNSKLELIELYNYIKPQVERTSRRLYNNEQTPQLMTVDEQLKKIGLRQ